MLWFEYFERWRVELAYRLLRWVYSRKGADRNWYPQTLIMQIDENQEWLVDCQKLIAVAEWIKDGTASNIVAVLCEGHTQDPDTGEYLRSVEDAVRRLIGESCLNAHHLVVSYENLGELNETASAIIQCSGIGILKPNTIIVDFPTCGTSANFVYPGQNELWIRVSATTDKCLLICKGDLWKPVPTDLTSTLDLWWVVENDDMLLSFVYLICRNCRWTFTKLRIFCVLKETEMEAVKQSVNERIQSANLEVDSVQYLSMHPEDITAYTGARTTNENRESNMDEQTKLRRIYRNEPPLGLNSLMRGESQNADLVIINLPRPRGDMPATRLLQCLDAITERLPRVVIFRPTADPC